VRAGSSLTIYLNGTAAAADTLTSQPIYMSLPEMHLGCGGYGYPLNGALDEFGIWQRALAAEEVGQLYNGGSGLPLENF